MERKFKLITSDKGTEFGQVTTDFHITDDSVSVLSYVYVLLSELGVDADETFSVQNENGDELFTEEDLEESDDFGDVYICRWCGIRINSSKGVFVETSSDFCHCEDCHSKLYYDEEWNALYNEWNVNEEGEEFCTQAFYYTTAPQNY